MHALSEARRVLRHGGALIDLRPAMSNRRVELELAGTRLHIGEIDYAYRFPDHIAANEALDAAIAAGRLRLEHRASLEYVTDIDTVADFREYEASLRQDAAPEGMIHQVEALTANESDHLIRIRRELVIARYRKTEGSPPAT